MPDAVVLTASAGTLPGLVDALRAIPVVVEERPLMTFAPPGDWGPMDRALDALSRFEVIALTSPRAARAFAERLESRGLAGELTEQGARVWASGAGTAVVLGGKLGPVLSPAQSVSGELGAAAALADALLASGVRGPVLFPCGEVRREELPARLRGAGVEVEEVVCYRSVLA
ncbi:MAG: uroporphyrinogen-III synthase, partial [Gemmatimonadales bacterium]